MGRVKVRQHHYGQSQVRCQPEPGEILGRMAFQAVRTLLWQDIVVAGRRELLAVRSQAEPGNECHECQMDGLEGCPTVT